MSRSVLTTSMGAIEFLCIGNKSEVLSIRLKFSSQAGSLFSYKVDLLEARFDMPQT